MMKNKSNWLTIIAFFFSLQVSAAELSPIEKKIQQDSMQMQTAELNWLRQLVLINSGTTNISGIKKVGAMAAKQLQQLGFKIQWVNLPKNMQRGPTLIAKRTGHHGKHILLIGHLDTVFAKENPFQGFKRKTKTATGPGIIDDKGGIAVMLFALKALDKQHLLTDKTITVVLTGDEEESGKPTSISRKSLLSAAKNMDVALDFEPNLNLDSASIGRRGISNWRIDSFGQEGHSATLFAADIGDGAIYEMARILQAFLSEFKHEKYLTVNPGRMVGGNNITDQSKQFKSSVQGKENVVAKLAQAFGDVRYLSLEQKNRFIERAEKIVAAHLPHCQSTITFEDGIPAMTPSKNNAWLLEQYSLASMDLGAGKVSELDAGLRGAGDISYVAAIVPYNLVGLGAGGYGMHASGETLEIDSLRVQTARAAILMYRLLNM